MAVSKLGQAFIDSVNEHIGAVGSLPIDPNDGIISGKEVESFFVEIAAKTDELIDAGFSDAAIEGGELVFKDSSGNTIDNIPLVDLKSELNIKEGLWDLAVNGIDLTTDKKVGVGESDPQEALEVVGNILGDKLRTKDGEVLSEGDVQLFTKESDGTYKPYLTIKKDTGNVGLLTVAPTARLDVAGDGRIRALQNKSNDPSFLNRVVISNTDGFLHYSTPYALLQNLYNNISAANRKNLKSEIYTPFSILYHWTYFNQSTTGFTSNYFQRALIAYSCGKKTSIYFDFAQGKGFLNSPHQPGDPFVAGKITINTSRQEVIDTGIDLLPFMIPFQLNLGRKFTFKGYDRSTGDEVADMELRLDGSGVLELYVEPYANINVGPASRGGVSVELVAEIDFINSSSNVNA